MAEQTEPVKVRLRWDDPGTGLDHEYVDTLPITLGRAADNSIVLNSQAVSRQHARLEWRDQIVVVDQSSTNGTTINGQLVEPHQPLRLHPGDNLQIGPFAFNVIIQPQPDIDLEAATEQTVRLENQVPLAAAGPDQTPSGASPTAPPNPRISLSWTDPETGQPHEQTFEPPVTFGRSSQNSLKLGGPAISRRHAFIDLSGAEASLIDRNSTNGTFLNGNRIDVQAALQDGDIVRIGNYNFTLHLSHSTPSQPAIGPTLFFDEKSDILRPGSIPDLIPDEFPPPAFIQAEKISPEKLVAFGLPVEETIYLALGGGLGSFIWADHLIIYGVPADQIVAIGIHEKPYGRYRRLCSNSQIPDHERLRSNSDSCPDNIWGWPGYAVREMWSLFKQRGIGRAAAIGWQIFNEPTFAETYTPRSGDVFASIDREAERIGWPQIWRYGRIRALRQMTDGRYVVAYSQTRPHSQGEQTHKFIIGRYVHLALGYPAIRLLPDLQTYREQTRDFKSVINAYEEHEHIYDHLAEHGGLVLIRGRGIVASRIIQRLYEVRDQNPNVQIVHLLRSPLAVGHRYMRARRAVAHNWEFQPFNWPKACWGGDLRVVLEQSHTPERDQLLNDWGGTTTADRHDWMQIIDLGQREGWYQVRFGDVERVECNEAGRLVTVIRGRGAVQEETHLTTDFIIDATGLIADLDFNPVYKDLVRRYQLARNVKGRLEVTNDFEMAGLRNGLGRVYTSGVMTLGGPYAPVDSFLGLQYAAQRAVDALTRLGAPGLHGLNSLRSLGQWLRWARGARP